MLFHKGMLFEGWPSILDGLTYTQREAHGPQIESLTEPPHSPNPGGVIRPAASSSSPHERSGSARRLTKGLATLCGRQLRSFIFPLSLFNPLLHQRHRHTEEALRCYGEVEEVLLSLG